MKAAFSWHGLPQYAARQIAAVLRRSKLDCPVIGSRPSVPVEGMERSLGRPVHWVDAEVPASWSRLGLEVPDVFFQSGWAYPAFSCLGDEVRAAGGKVCLLMDNNWRGDLRQMFGAPWYRIFQRRKFAAVFVPGKSGRRLARWYGVPDERIWEGMYGADPSIFFAGPPLDQRPKRILFVGQYVERKQCVQLARAFLSVADSLPEWKLEMYGSGPLKELIPIHPRIEVNGFVQPEQLGALYRSARIFALPSLSEAWGLVVHEAALSGCQLLLSEAIGSRQDFATSANAAVFRTGDVRSMAASLLKLAEAPTEQLSLAFSASVSVASSHGPEAFAASAEDIVRRLSL